MHWIASTSTMGVSLGLALLLTVPAGAQSLKEKKAIREAEKRLVDGGFAEAEKHCGAKVSRTVDWKSFTGKYTGNHSPAVAANFCNNIGDGIRWACDEQEGKVAVAGQLRAVRCVWDADAVKAKLGRHGPSLKFEKGVLTAGYSFETSNMSDEVKAFLGRELVAGKYKLGDAVAIRKARKTFEQSRSFTMTNDACGVDLSYAADWPSFLSSLEGNKSHSSVLSYCGSVFDGLWSVCSDPDGKAAVQAAVKRVECRFDASATKEKLGRYGPKLELKKGTLRAAYGWDTSNIQDATKEWLMNEL